MKLQIPFALKKLQGEISVIYILIFYFGLFVSIMSIGYLTIIPNKRSMKTLIEGGAPKRLTKIALGTGGDLSTAHPSCNNVHPLGVGPLTIF